MTDAMAGEDYRHASGCLLRHDHAEDMTTADHAVLELFSSCYLEGERTAFNSAVFKQTIVAAFAALMTAHCCLTKRTADTLL